MPNSDSNDSFLQLVAETVPECTDATADYWFADEDDEDEKYGKSEQAIAVSICGRCPIKRDCFMHAINNNINHGVWGGSVPAQRAGYKSKSQGLYAKVAGSR